MKRAFLLLSFIAVLNLSCDEKAEDEKNEANEIFELTGTWTLDNLTETQKSFIENKSNDSSDDEIFSITTSNSISENVKIIISEDPNIIQTIGNYSMNIEYKNLKTEQTETRIEEDLEFFSIREEGISWNYVDKSTITFNQTRPYNGSQPQISFSDNTYPVSLKIKELKENKLVLVHREFNKLLSINSEYPDTESLTRTYEFIKE